MIRDYQKEYQDLQRSNQERKLKLAVRNGFANVEDYRNYLKKGTIVKEIVKKVKKSKIKPTIHNVVLLDATYSMSGPKYDNSIKGILKELEWIKTQTEVNYTVTVEEFIEEDKYDKEIKKKTHTLLNNPNSKNLHFYGARGNNTPLYKAVLDIIEKVQPGISDSDKVLLKVYTDGDNNRLEHYKSICANKIKEVQSKNFTVTFVGTNYDLRRIIDDLKLEESNCLAIDNTGEGFKEAFNKSLNSTQVYTQSVLDGKDVSKGFYKKLNN